MPPTESGKRGPVRDTRGKRAARPKKGGFLNLPTVLIVVVAIAAIAGVLAWGVSAGSGGKERELPSYAYNSSLTLAGYKAAVAHQDELRYIPCYCGCGPAEGHQSLKECFFKPDGSFEAHASGCHVCVEEASDVAKWLGDGKTLAQVRVAIDEKFGGHSPGTDTPAVPAGM